jgi:hypothetical protein
MSGAAARQRRYRQRRAAGLVSIELEVDEVATCRFSNRPGCSIQWRSMIATILRARSNGY